MSLELEKERFRVGRPMKHKIALLSTRAMVGRFCDFSLLTINVNN
jgi:hypothetical protein